MDEKSIKYIIEEYNNHIRLRDESIKLSFDIIRLSKRIITSILYKRDENIERLINEIKDLTEKAISSELECIFEISYQEFIESYVFYHIIYNNTIPKLDFSIPIKSKIGGLIDVVGELLRYAIINVNNNEFKRIKEFIIKISFELMNIKLYDKDIRKKMDSLKWYLKKIEEITSEINLKNGIKNK